MLVGSLKKLKNKGMLLMDLQDAEMKKTENDGLTKYGDQIQGPNDMVHAYILGFGSQALNLTDCSGTTSFGLLNLVRIAVFEETSFGNL